MKNRKMMIVAVLLTLLVVFNLFAACGEGAGVIKVEKIVFAEESVTLFIGDTQQLSYTLYPENAVALTAVWTSSDSSIAKVDASGVVTAVAQGKCTITVSIGEVSATVNVEVKRKGPDFKYIYEVELLGNQYGVDVGSDGSYLSIDTKPLNSKYEDAIIESILNTIKKTHKLLGLPESLYSEMVSTTALMGRQTRTYPSLYLEVSWTYHPDRGLEIMYMLYNV